MACERFQRATRKCSLAPEEAFTAAGVTSTVCASGKITPCTPTASAVRKSVPKFCGSLSESRISTKGGSPFSLA
jgi:hypothetical protein